MAGSAAPGAFSATATRVALSLLAFPPSGTGRTVLRKQADPWFSPRQSPLTYPFMSVVKHMRPHRETSSMLYYKDNIWTISRLIVRQMMKNSQIYNLSFHSVNLTCQKNASYVHGIDFTAYVHLGTRPLQMLGNGKSDDLVKFHKMSQLDSCCLLWGFLITSKP